LSAGLVFADTDVIIDFFNGLDPMASLVERLIITRRLRLPAVTAFELRAGVIGSCRLDAIDQLLKIVSVIPFGREDARLAAEHYTKLKRKGRLDNSDLMIAATSQRAGAPLLTRNKKHFERIEGLDLYEG
jgi:tRNA(fMet)-specific endonuclease VapC